MWTPSHGQAKVWWAARTYLQQLCADTGCSLEDLLGVMDDTGKRWSGKSMLAAHHDDDDDDDITVCENLSLGSFKNVIYKMFLKILFNIYA